MDGHLLGSGSSLQPYKDAHYGSVLRARNYLVIMASDSSPPPPAGSREGHEDLQVLTGFIRGNISEYYCQFHIGTFSLFLSIDYSFTFQ